MIQNLLRKVKELEYTQVLFLFLLTDVFFISLHILHKIPTSMVVIPLLQENAFSIS